MKILDQIEGLMENVIEGVFRRNIKRPLQPIEVGKKLISAMEAQKRVSIANTYVPNYFKVHLHPDQVDEFKTLQNTLIQELKGVLYQKAEKEYLSFIGNLRIEFHEDQSLNSGIIAVEAYFLEESLDSTGEFKLSSKQLLNVQTQVFNKRESTIVKFPSFLMKNGKDRACFELQEYRNYSIGRSPKCDFVIDDHNISRIHAWIEFVNNQWYMKDHDSTNGTFINEEKISKVLLVHGDQVRIGTTILIFQDDK